MGVPSSSVVFIGDRFCLLNGKMPLTVEQSAMIEEKKAAAKARRKCALVETTTDMCCVLRAARPIPDPYALWLGRVCKPPTFARESSFISHTVVWIWWVFMVTLQQ
jgi:hypothetical protein